MANDGRAGLADEADKELLPSPPPQASASSSSSAPSVAASSSSGAASSSSLCVAPPISWESYDEFVRRGDSKYPQVVDPDTGNVIGELQPLGGAKYQVVGKCMIPGHSHSGNKCARMRAWKVAGNENPCHVDRVLLHWLLAGRTVHPRPGNTLREAHQACPRF